MSDITNIHDNIKELLNIACKKEIENIKIKIENLTGLINQLETISFDNNVINNLKDELSILNKYLNVNIKTNSLINNNNKVLN